MVSKFALLSNLLLASAVLAAPSSRLGARLARRRENRQSKPVNHVASSAGPASNVSYSSNWAGVALEKDNGTFTSVTGIFTVPTPSGSDGASSAWVGIDGSTCDNAILQTGVDFELNGGVPSYEAWYEWFPDYSIDYPDFTVNPGDVIMAAVAAYDTSYGITILENLTTGQIATQMIGSSYLLCEQDAEWIVEDYDGGDGLVPFGDFGTVTFSYATATDSSGNIYTPSDATAATIYDIRHHGVVFTAVSTSGDTVTIQYV